MASSLIDFFLENTAAYFIARELEQLGLHPILIAILSILMAVWVVKLGLELLTLPKKMELSQLDPNNLDMMRSAYSDVRLRVNVADELGEELAGTIHDFVSQIRRLGHFKKAAWSEVSLNDDVLLNRLYSDKKIVALISERLNTAEANSLEKFRSQVAELQKLKGNVG